MASTAIVGRMAGLAHVREDELEPVNHLDGAVLGRAEGILGGREVPFIDGSFGALAHEHAYDQPFDQAS